MRINAGLGCPIPETRKRWALHLTFVLFALWKALSLWVKEKAWKDPRGQWPGKGKVGKRNIPEPQYCRDSWQDWSFLLLKRFSLKKRFPLKKMCLDLTHNNFWFDTFSVCLSVPKCSHCWCYSLMCPKVLNMIYSYLDVIVAGFSVVLSLKATFAERERLLLWFHGLYVWPPCYADLWNLC